MIIQVAIQSENPSLTVCPVFIFIILYMSNSLNHFLTSSKMVININSMFNIYSEHIQLWQKAGSEFRNLHLKRTFISLPRALASHQCDPGSNPGVHAICGLSLLLVLSFVLRGFSPGTPVFHSRQKPTIPNSNCIQNTQFQRVLKNS